MTTACQPKNFFISYNHRDSAWAEWIAWQLENDGYSTIIQAKGVCVFGSARGFGDRGILGCFLESDEFRLGYRHPLRLQEQIAQILVAPTAS